MAEYKYDAWGKPIGDVPENGVGAISPFRYRGYAWDAELEMYYLRSRFFRVEINRFINLDLDLSSRGSLFKHNGFTYCGNKVILYKDESGRGLISTLISRDKFAKKILDWYISGGGEKRIVVSKEWGTALLTQEPALQTTINNKIKQEISSKYASGFEVGKKYPINIKFHAEVTNGESASLNCFLHGTEATVGDFEIVGEFSFEPNGDELIAEFSVDCIWNDVIDANYNYMTDRVKNAVLNIVTLGSPQKYDLHICWNMDNSGINDYTGTYMSPYELWCR